MNKKILKSQLSLFYLIGPLFFKYNDLEEAEKKQLKMQKTFSIKSIMLFIVLGFLFSISSRFLEQTLLFFLFSFALPAYTIFYITMILIGYSEIKKGKIFFFPI